MDIKERIKQFINYKGITVKAFEIQCNLSNGYISSMRKGFGADKLNNVLTEFPELNRDWLLYGEGEMLRQAPESNAHIVGAYVPPQLGDPGVYRIPALPVGAQATFAESMSDTVYVNPFEDFRDVPLLPEELAIKDRLINIQVDGESMEPTLADGAWVLSRQLKESQWGNASGVVFVSYGEYFVVKRVKVNRLFTENYMTLSSDNKDYGEMTVQLSEIHAIWKALRIVSSPVL